MGCSGICCAAFTMSHSLGYMREHQATIRDGAYIVDMLIPLTYDEAIVRRYQFGHKSGPLASDDLESEYFTCRHWNETTRQCGAYESRPGMCRKFPYAGKPCDFGCDLTLPLREKNGRFAAKVEGPAVEKC
jgi:Fe-S-cluster containining protein